MEIYRFLAFSPFSLFAFSPLVKISKKLLLKLRLFKTVKIC